MKVGILTGGGDAPGLNAVIRAVVRKLILNDHEVIGIREGWKGLLDCNFEPLDRNSVSGILLVEEQSLQHQELTFTKLKMAKQQ